MADAFAICARQNNCVMLIADGVNWGEKSRLAARSALYGSMVYINNRVFKRHRQPANTHVSMGRNLDKREYLMIIFLIFHGNRTL